MKVGDTIELAYHSVGIGVEVVDVRNKLDNSITKYIADLGDTVDKALLTSMSTNTLMKMQYMILDELRERRL